MKAQKYRNKSAFQSNKSSKLRWRWLSTMGILTVTLLGFGVANANILDDFTGLLKGWPVYGKDSKHTGAVNVRAQGIKHVLAEFVLDANAQAEFNDEGELLTHYQSPLLKGNDVYSEIKGGTYTPSDPDTGLLNWNTQTWGEKKLSWVHGALVQQWVHTSSWVPTPYTADPRVTYGPGVGTAWEPVFGGALANDAVYVPESGGRVAKLSEANGHVIKMLNAFGHTTNDAIFVTSPITADKDGNVYFTASQFAIPAGTTDPTARSTAAWTNDVVNSWLVKIKPNDDIDLATFKSLTPGAISATAQCGYSFASTQLPFPPSPTAQPLTTACGSQRATVNTIPAIDDDGTIYVVSRAHFVDRYGYLVAVKANLKPKWMASLRGRLKDGCGVSTTLPANGAVGGCRAGAKLGVDPATNDLPAARLLDDSSASPTIAPDGSIFFGVYTRYNRAQGHMLHFNDDGKFLNSYDFGWDNTPAISKHNGTYSAVFKENRYGEVGSYCNDATICPPDRNAEIPNDPEAYYISSFSPNLTREWAYKNVNTNSCVRDAQGNVTCTSTNPDSFEWCVNAVSLDKNGTAFASGEDGVMYQINSNGHLVDSQFMNLSIAAAYTPNSIDDQGRLYGQNFGDVIVFGN